MFACLHLNGILWFGSLNSHLPPCIMSSWMEETWELNVQFPDAFAASALDSNKVLPRRCNYERFVGQKWGWSSSTISWLASKVSWKCEIFFCKQSFILQILGWEKGSKQRQQWIPGTRAQSPASWSSDNSSNKRTVSALWLLNLSYNHVL